MIRSASKKRIERLSTKIILMTELVLLVSIGVLCVISVVNSRDSIRKAIQQRMLDIANCASGSVNGDILETLTAEDAGTPGYLSVYDALAVFRDNVELEFVYGIKDEGDGRFTFTVDPSLEDQAPFWGEVKYTEALATAARGTAAVDEVPYSDAWGSFYSAYSPVFNTSGKVAGIIGVDFSEEWFDSQLTEQTRRNIITFLPILLLTLVVTGILSILAVTPFVEQQEQLSEEVAEKAEENEKLLHQVTRALEDAMQTLANTIDAKDHYTKGHSTRVSQYSTMIAQALGWDAERVNDLRCAALLHDIGKIGVPDSILNKPTRLTDLEFSIIKSHTTIGGDILRDRIMIESAGDVARGHHERYDGKGYPFGLKGEDIPEGARIVAVADAFDAMSSDRVYRKACSRDYIRQELESGRGKQFDPQIADVFIDMFDRGLLDPIMTKDSVEDVESREGTSALLQVVVEAFVAQSTLDNLDVVTGVMNRSAGEAVIAVTMQQENGCFVLFDLDNLKKVNDTNGHAAGDRALRLMGETLTEHGDRSLCCRLGGDEFLYFIKTDSPEQAEERVREIIGDFEAKKKGIPEIAAASVSAGMTMSTPDEVYSRVFNKADKALYYVKQNGKNSYSFFNEEAKSAEYEQVDVDKLISGLRNSGSYSKRQIYLPFTIAASGGCERARKEFCRFAARARRGVNDQNEIHFDVYDIMAPWMSNTGSS